MTEQSPRFSNAPPPQLGRVAFHAVASGLAPLIPIPFLDDYALRQVRERMVRAVLQDHSLPTPAKAVSVLAGSQNSITLGGRVINLFKGLALLPLKKVFRKAFILLWVKDCVDMASYSLHHGYLLQHALTRGDLTALTLDGDAPLRVHDAILAACKEQDSRPINQLLSRLFASSKLLLSEATKAIMNPLLGQPRVPEKGEEAEVASLADRLAAALWEQRGYFSTLEERYQRHLQGGPTPSL
ncbi:hypothetical protein [Hyalangium minutum]|uniref:Uncharacterized protein n=1 Tax=Hyalangium minutum TaxID=394096 RepID=A0A085VTW2_9BACT|nr:hypothetical protein [Hyalangium minutum]KFE58875.1 hypothetical protein DB31_6172 [Hyalangium minutum]